MRQSKVYPQLKEMKAKLNKAFAILRKEGMFARQNFMCCQGCACAVIPKDVKYCFYHQQDNDSLKRSGKVYLAFGNCDGGISIEQVGDFIKETMESVGLKVEWDGSTNTRILVTNE